MSSPRTWPSKIKEYAETNGLEWSAKGVLLGSYDWGWLCLPTWPYCRKEKRAPSHFFGVNELLSVLLAAAMGLQHALAMIGLAVPPLLIAMAANDQSTSEYLISAAFIVSGICTLVHVIQIPVVGTKIKYGTGVLSVAGVSFAFISPAQNSIAVLMDQGFTFDQAFGKLLGTLMVCSLLCVAVAFMPPRVLRRVFPPHVSGVVILLIGAALVQSAMYNWGGGSFCGTNTAGLPPTQLEGCMLPDSTGELVNATCYTKPYVPLCTGNGQVELPFGSPEYIGMGFFVFAILIFIEIFGSPFMRNTAVIIALLLGYLVAATVKRDGQSYLDTSTVAEAPTFTFLWVKTFPIGFHAPSILPFLVAFIVTVVESIGDITATEEVSGLETSGEPHRRRIQGGLLADGVNGILGALATSLPTSTFAANNGIINLTRVGSRSAGIACGLWLIAFGIIGKLGAFILSIPNCVLGGVLAFLFANVAVSGIKIITLGNLARRTRFILSVSLALGLGVSLVPNWPTNSLWNVTPGMSSGVRGFRDACILLLSNGYSVGAVTSIILTLILPEDATENPVDVTKPGGLYDPTVRGGMGVTRQDVMPGKPENLAPQTVDSMDRDDTAERPRGPVATDSIV